MPMLYIDGKGYNKLELLKATGFIKPIIPGPNHAISHLWPPGWTHTNTHAYPHENDFKSHIAFI